MERASFGTLGKRRRILQLKQVLFASTVVVTMPMIVAMPTVIIVFFPDVHPLWRPVIIFAVFIVFRFVDDRRRVHSWVVHAITGHINVMIPRIFNKIDRTTAGPIGIAVFIPVLDMAGRDSKVDRRIPGANRTDNDWFAINKTRWRVVADVETAVESGIANGD
jgi:hypothetical protein